MLGWIGNLFTLTGFWFAGCKYRWSFILMLIGNILWAMEAMQIKKFELFFINFVLGFIAIMNFVKWKNEKRCSYNDNYMGD
jgi:hypothetical protein